MSADDDARQVEEELNAVEAIFGDDCVVDHDAKSLRVWVPNKNVTPAIELAVLFPSEGYPSSTPPVVSVRAPHLSDDVLESLQTELDALFLPGEVCLLQATSSAKCHNFENITCQIQHDAKCGGRPIL